jgi:single-strand DNA-binding protein
MADINEVIEIGRLTRDIELSYTPGGMAIGNFSIAVSRNIKKDNQWTEETNYFDIKVFGNQAKNLGPYLIKGKQVGIEGYLHQDRWEKDGQKKSRVVIIANNIQLCGGKDKDGGQRNDYQEDSYPDDNPF